MEEYILIAKVQNGDKDAFQKLIGLYYPYVFKFLLQLSGDETLSQDLTQDTFVKVIQNIDRYDLHGKGSFSTYVMTIAKHLYIDYLRKNKYLLINWEEQETTDPMNVGELVATQLEFEQVAIILKELPPEQAEPIRMKYLEQMTLSQIARQLNTQPKTIKSRIHGGMVKMRKLLRAGGKKDG